MEDAGRSAHSWRMDARLALLAALAIAPGHPYALLEHLQGLGIAVSRSALYRAADALIAEGLAEAAVEEGETGHLRRRLALTAAGRERLAAAALAALRTEPLDGPGFALALAAAEAAGAGEAGRAIRERLAAAARRLTALERELRNPGADAAFQPLREREAARLRADIGWLQAQLRRAG